MKFFTRLSLLVLVVSIVACGSDDDNGNTNNANYFPLDEGAAWTYDNTAELGDSRDSLYYVNDQQLNGNTYANLDAEQPANAFMTTILSENLLRTSGSALIVNGDLGTVVLEGFPEINVPLDDVRLFDGDASVGDELAIVTDEFTQDFMGFPFVVTFSVRSVQGETLPSYTAGGTPYDNVIASQIIVNAQVVANIDLAGTTIEVPILVSQDVITATNYYAEDVGLIFSDVELNYQLEDLSGVGIEFPFPTEANQTSTQTLDTFVAVINN